MTLPKFYDPSLVGTLYMPRKAAIRAAVNENKHEFKGDTAGNQTSILIIDAQGDFCLPGGSLFVPGAVEDNTRLIEFLYRNIEQIKYLDFTLDTHRYVQVFFPLFWRDSQGNHPEPYTVISYADVVAGRWIPALAAEIVREYLRQLESTGKYKLTIWEYHTDEGSVGGALAPALTELAVYHSLLWETDPTFHRKGLREFSECYSVFGEEVRAVTVAGKQVSLGQYNDKLLASLLNRERIYVAGQAASHCVKATLEDIIFYAQNNLSNPVEFLSKFYILEDCMSPVPAIPGVVDFPQIARAALHSFAAAGMQVVKSTEDTGC
ncbi:hypothetical protein [Sporomusa aerivorans]|uniref:hypothetical protein n=1 Tax=Sporomusa aerivorans TaxID=204936 RepID=UPI00352A5BDB